MINNDTNVGYKEYYSSLFEKNHSIMLLINPNSGDLIDVNDAACDFYGYVKEEFLTKKIWEINMLPKDKVLIEMKRAIENKQWRFEFKHKLSSGEIRDVEAYSGQINIHGQIYLYSIIHDITKRKETEEQLKKLSRAIEQSPNPVIITNLQGEIEYINPKFVQQTGYRWEEVKGKTPRILKSGEKSSEEYKELWDIILSGKDWQGLFHNRKKNGELFWEYAYISPIKDDNGNITHFVGIKEDVTERKKAEDMINYLAYHDSLTNLPNRIHYNELLTEAIEQTKHTNRMVAVMVLDLDGFKEVNDTYGHAVGDLVLKEVANRLRKNVRENDTIARMGGDEFFSFIPDISQTTQVEIIAKKILQVIEQPILIKEKTVNITTSIGICLYPQNGDDIESLIQKADIAMYHVKKSGKNNFRFY